MTEKIEIPGIETIDVRAEFQGGFTQPRTRTAFLGVHHAAFDYPSSDGISDVRSVAQYHIQSNGWSGIGYQVCLAEKVNGGPIVAYIVSDLDTMRANVFNRNHEVIGVCLLTDTNKQPGGVPSQKWLDALATVLRWLKTLYPSAHIVGHRDIALSGGETSCPGHKWSEWKPRLLQLVEAPMVALETFPALKRYRTTMGANLRRLPTLDASAVIASLPKGVVFDASRIVSGAAVGTDKRWLDVPGLGFLHMTVVEEAPVGTSVISIDDLQLLVASGQELAAAIAKHQALGVALLDMVKRGKA